MKKLAAIVVLTGAGIMTCGIGMANAAEQPQSTASIGYAYSHIKDFGNLNGVNLSYRYEFTPEWGVIGSFSWVKGSNTDDFNYKSKVDANMYSLLVGPTYRMNDYVSFYAQAGAAFAHVKANDWYDDGSSDSYSGHNTGFAYGAGVQFNPVENVAVTVGYEGSSFSNKKNINSSFSPNGFNIGVGYRF
ncbi:TPA: Ail/Lom family outer membrane beta-barrel protein [Klebsiella oxytoca]|uniref:Ail/Lom family outer membrane beta-barrel protein n=1 Tax=Klebsiella oxytoca TaxID=571 RepID=A0AAN5LE10_KLEOX|nr:Ail/Lom family outer membrane beta-barrel protein [Klebsiella oxytoca]